MQTDISNNLVVANQRANKAYRQIKRYISCMFNQDKDKYLGLISKQWLVFKKALAFYLFYCDSSNSLTVARLCNMHNELMELMNSIGVQLNA